MSMLVRRIVNWFRLKLFSGKNSIFYIGGSDTLPPPLSAEEENRAIMGFMAGSK